MAYSTAAMFGVFERLSDGQSSVLIVESPTVVFAPTYGLMNPSSSIGMLKFRALYIACCSMLGSRAAVQGANQPQVWLLSSVWAGRTSVWEM